MNRILDTIERTPLWVRIIFVVSLVAMIIAAAMLAAKAGSVTVDWQQHGNTIALDGFVGNIQSLVFGLTGAITMIVMILMAIMKIG